MKRRRETVHDNRINSTSEERENEQQETARRQRERGEMGKIWRKEGQWEDDRAKKTQEDRWEKAKNEESQRIRVWERKKKGMTDQEREINQTTGRR